MPDSDADAILEVTIDPRSLDPVRLLVFELIELRDRLRADGLTEHADSLNASIARLTDLDQDDDGPGDAPEPQPVPAGGATA